MRRRRRQNHLGSWLDTGSKNEVLMLPIGREGVADPRGPVLGPAEQGCSIVTSVSVLLLLAKCEKRRMFPWALKTPKKRTAPLTTGARPPGLPFTQLPGGRRHLLGAARWAEATASMSLPLGLSPRLSDSLWGHCPTHPTCWMNGISSIQLPNSDFLSPLYVWCHPSTLRANTGRCCVMNPTLHFLSVCSCLSL